MDELLAMDAFKPLTGGAGFCSNMFIVPKHSLFITILSVKRFNYCMHITIFKMATTRQVQQVIQQGDYAFSIDLKDDYLHILPFGNSASILWTAYDP